MTLSNQQSRPCFRRKYPSIEHIMILLGLIVCRISQSYYFSTQANNGGSIYSTKPLGLDKFFVLEPAHFILLLLCRLKNLVDTEDTLEIHLGKKRDSYIYSSSIVAWLIVRMQLSFMNTLCHNIDREAWSSGVS